MAGKKGHDNLIPFTARTAEEQRRIRVMGGIASGEARGFKKRLSEVLDDELTLEKRAEIARAIIKQAAKGNTKAFEIIRDSIGEKPRQEFEVFAEEKSEGLRELEGYMEVQRLEGILNLYVIEAETAGREGREPMTITEAIAEYDERERIQFDRFGTDLPLAEKMRLAWGEEQEENHEAENDTENDESDGGI